MAAQDKKVRRILHFRFTMPDVAPSLIVFFV